jgi:hypothetical protein
MACNKSHEVKARCISHGALYSSLVNNNKLLLINANQIAGHVRIIAMTQNIIIVNFVFYV